jgi:hypothetical protein
MKFFTTTILIFFFAYASFSQTETLTNNEIILMTRAGLSKDLIVRKINDSSGKYDTSAQALIELKKSGVADEIISLMMEKVSNTDSKTETVGFSDSIPIINTSTSHIILEPKEALRSAKTIAIEKSSLHPSRQALEKELLKRKEWKDLNLNIVRYKENADLYIEIGFVPLSLITHRYVWRVYDNKSGTVIAAGETTSWGSLAKNLAREITKKIGAIAQN